MEERGRVVCAARRLRQTTTTAAMIDDRNSNKPATSSRSRTRSSICRAEKSIVNQCEIGVDTQWYNKALANALREVPDRP